MGWGGVGLGDGRFVTSARQLAKNLELPTVNDLGYTKRYVRCLQVRGWEDRGSWIVDGCGWSGLD